ncbi:MAG: dihydroorotate dehydrogenase [Candidatus Micrarchaeota archaeon]|nr:dihydroorotate dehydrogenase [Candidatus Micrarchaeota archaeon]
MLAVSFCGMRLRNPLILASGIRGNSADLLIRAAKEGAGAVTSKSCSLKPREGHANPTAVNEGAVWLNAIGLSNPGVEEEVVELKKAVKHCGVPVIASIVGFSVEEFGLVASKISQANPAMIEIDASCPNVEGKGKMFSSCVEDAVLVTREVRKSTSLPISIKLSADVPNIGEIASECISAGANCITAINTVGGMYIDAYAQRPVLHNWFGGVSGPAIKPIALKAVYNIRKAVGPDVPIIGTGGVVTGLDAVEMIMAGATAVGIGTAVAIRKNAFREISKEMKAFMKKKGFRSISDIKLIEK